MKPIRFLGALSIAMVGLLVFVADGSARKPQPSSGPTITYTSGSISTIGSASGDLLIKWTESGLTPGTYPPLDYEVDGSATSTYICLSGGSAVQFSCANPATTATGAFACSVTDGPGALLDFEFSGLSGSKTSVSNTVAVDEPYSGTMSSDCANAGGSLLLYQVQYSNITMWDTTFATQSAAVGSFQATLCNDTRLSGCPSVL